MKTIVLDFDGVIHRYSRGWHDGSCYDEPMQGAEFAISRLLEEYTVAIVSTRDPDQIKQWMFEKMPAVVCVVMEPKEQFWNMAGIVGITNRKIAAEAYIDDRAIPFRGNWPEILAALCEKQKAG